MLLSWKLNELWNTATDGRDSELYEHDKIQSKEKTPWETLGDKLFITQRRVFLKACLLSGI